MKPVYVFIDGKELEGYTGLKLSRSKSNLTGSLSIDIFMTHVPETPVIPEANGGKEILVYIGSHLAFNGVIDRRADAAKKTQVSLSAGPSTYSITFTCRGKARDLIDSSHQHETGTLRNTSNKRALEELIAPWGIELDWRATEIPLPRLRLRDGSRVVDEIHRLAEMTSLHVFETRDGKLRVLDKADTEQGEDIILGENILSFSTDQLADFQRSHVVVKGQKVAPGVWGEQAVLNTILSAGAQGENALRPIVVQLYGDATEQLLERRATYEMNKRVAQGKKIQVEVFHVQQRSGDPWDVGLKHFVSIPPAGVYGEFETTAVEYTVTNRDKLSTKLTLSPPPVAGVEGAGYQQTEDAETPQATDSLDEQPAQRNELFDSPSRLWDAPSLRASPHIYTESPDGLSLGATNRAPLTLPER